MLKKSLKIQQKLVEVAISIIRQKGSVTLKDIAEQADCNIAAVNYHFKDKASFNKVIVNTVFDETLEWARATEKVKVCSSSDETIKVIIEYTMQFIEQNFGVFKYVLAMSGEEGITEALLSKLDELMTLVLKHLEKIMTNFTKEELEIKYSILLSGYIMPLILSTGTVANRYFNNREGYVKEMIKGFMA